MSKQHKIHTSTKYLILLGFLLLIANLVFGFTLIESFSKTIKETWDRSILNFANTVAAVQDLPNTGEAIAALTMLGYSQSDASVAVSKLDPALSVQDLRRGALKLLSRGV